MARPAPARRGRSRLRWIPDPALLRWSLGFWIAAYIYLTLRSLALAYPHLLIQAALRIPMVVIGFALCMLLAAAFARLQGRPLKLQLPAIAAGVASLMSCHVLVPAFDELRPGTLSPAIVQGLLRDELGFDGLVVSDAFDMGGLVAHYTPGEAAILGILAGEDQILKSPDIDAAIAAVVDAVRGGRIPEARIDEAVRRILEVKSRLSHSVGTPEEIFRVLDSQQHRDKADEIARKALTLLREEPGAMPLSKGSTAVILTVSDFDEVTNPLPTFAREVNRRVDNRAEVFLLDSRSQEEEIPPFLEAARHVDYVLLALAVRARSGAGRIALPEAARRAIEALPPEKKIIAVSFGSPYIIRELPSLETYFAAYGIQGVMQQAAVRAIFGEAGVSGRLPVTIPGLHARGSGIAR